MSKSKALANAASSSSLTADGDGEGDQSVSSRGSYLSSSTRIIPRVASYPIPSDNLGMGADADDASR